MIGVDLGLGGASRLTALFDGTLDFALRLRFLPCRFLRDAFEEIGALAFGRVLHQGVFEPVEGDDFEGFDLEGFFDCWVQLDVVSENRSKCWRDRYRVYVVFWVDVGSNCSTPPSSSANRNSGVKERVSALTDFRCLLPVLQAAYEVSDVGADLLGEGASVGFDPVSHLLVAASWAELAGEGNGEFLERVLHVVDLTDLRY